MRITVPERWGQCRWCRCTQERGRAIGCSWANRQCTLCSECVDLDRLMRTVGGRQALAERFQEREP